MSVAVLIPALNEEASLPLVLADLPRDYLDEVVVVNNGSTDGTAAVARAHGATVIDEPERGYGAACLAGLGWLARRPAGPPRVVVILDADYSDHPEDLPLLADPVLAGTYQMVLGSREIGQVEEGAMPPHQRFGNWLTTRLIGLRFGFRYTDMGPFRAIDFASLMDLGMTDRTWGWNVEMQCKALLADWAVHELPVRYRRRIGTSKISGNIWMSARAGVKIIYAIGRYAF